MGLFQILKLLTIVLIMIIGFLLLIYWRILAKEKEGKSKTSNRNILDMNNNSENQRIRKKANDYTKLSVIDFMEFDKIQDNMIIQDNGQRFLMVIECEGINYDLMSEVEKVSVEQGFIQFLNTLRYPIQLYIQTRTINISSSIENYKNKVNAIRKKLEMDRTELNTLIQSTVYNKKEIMDLQLEIAREQNLYDYGIDIIKNIEKMSLNKNVLKKHYYIIISCHVSDLGNNITNEEEKNNMIFSELYTRAQAISRTLFACNIKSKVLDSYGLADLLYVAYNRDESEVYGLDKAVRAGYDEAYSTAQDILDKKMNAINNAIEEKGLNLAKEIVDGIKSEKERIIEEKEETFDELVAEFAKSLIESNKQYIGEDVAKEAKKRIDSTKAKGGKKDEQKEKKTTTRRTTNAS